MHPEVTPESSHVSCRWRMRSMPGKTWTPVWTQHRNSCLSLGSQELKTGSPLDFKSYLPSTRQSSKCGCCPGSGFYLKHVTGPTWLLWKPMEQNQCTEGQRRECFWLPFRRSVVSFGGGRGHRGVPIRWECDSPSPVLNVP